MGTADYKKNRNFEPKAPQSKNAMYKKFSNIFDLIFDPNRYSLDDTFNKGLYLSNAQVEDDLATFIKHPGNNFAVMVGDTGIGKSTYIRKNICSKKVPTIRGDKVFIPFYGNAESVEYTACKSVIRSALDAAIDTIENSTKVLITPEKLYNYIEGHNKRYLFLADNSRQMSKKERLKALLEIDPYAYKAEELKYLCEYSHINDVILVLDDFEGLPNLTQYPFIEALHTYFQCTQNNTENNYSSKLLISLRPETYGMFKRTNVFNTYKPNHIIRIKTPVALKSLLIQRFNYLKSQKIIYGKISNMDAFEEASETFLDILDRFDGKIISLV